MMDIRHRSMMDDAPPEKKKEKEWNGIFEHKTTCLTTLLRRNKFSRTATGDVERKERIIE